MKNIFFLVISLFVFYSNGLSAADCSELLTRVLKSSDNIKLSKNSKKILNFVYNKEEVPPLAKMKPEDFLDAYEVLDKSFRDTFESILSNKRRATFANTIEPLEIESKRLYDLETSFAHLSYMFMSQYEQASLKLWGKVDELDSLYSRSKALYSRMKAIDTKNLTVEQKLVVKRYLDGFKKSGVSFSKKKKEQLNEIEKQLTELTTKYSHNAKNANEAFRLYIKSEDDLVGLPEAIVKVMKDEAKAEGKDDQWVFSMRNPSVMMGILKFSENRSLRKSVLLETRKIAQEGEFDNRQLVIDIVNLRHQKAKLLGFNNWSELALKGRMAKKVETVEKFYSDLVDEVRPIAIKEKKELEDFAYTKGHQGKLETWDRFYYLELMKKEMFGLDSQKVKEYFQLSHVTEGMFKLIKDVFNVEIKPVTINSYHKDVRAYEVYDLEKKRQKIGVIIYDPFARENKTDGAHHMKMRINDKNTPSIGAVVTNFPKAENGDALLEYRQVETLFHEFGHALHATLSKSKYLSTSSSTTPRDFVELQSQLLENFISEDYVLKMIGKHYQSGETIPLEMVEQLQKVNNFRKATTVLGQAQMGMIDMALYKKELDFAADHLIEWEQQVLEKTYLAKPDFPSSITVTFEHVISGGYSSGYYGYIWAEILDKDAYAYIMKNAQKNGLPNKKKVQRLKRWVYADSTLHPADEQYAKFKKGEPLDPSHFAKTISDND